MAPAMLVLVVPPWPAARGLLRNWLEQLQRKLQHNRLGLPLHPWGPALAVQGPAICTEPANDSNGSKAISSLLDSVFWMAAPKNRRSIEVNRCRRRNPQKLIKVKARAQSGACVPEEGPSSFHGKCVMQSPQYGQSNQQWGCGKGVPSPPVPACTSCWQLIANAPHSARCITMCAFFYVTV
uniref:Uncharacterized protein n=1 Tax=Sus scrofa TaxID=9823 RepID=A0A8D1HER4_PIG